MYTGIVISFYEYFISSITFDYSYLDLLFNILLLIISTTTILFTIKTKKLKDENLQDNILDNQLVSQEKFKDIRFFNILSIFNFIWGALFIVASIYFLLTLSAKIYSYIDRILPVIFNIIVFLYGSLEIYYVAKMRSIYRKMRTTINIQD